ISVARRKDTADEKRIELHAHTTMSQLDAVVSPTRLIEQAAHWGHEAIAITDHGNVQAYPEAYRAGKDHDIKILSRFASNPYKISITDHGNVQAYPEAYRAGKDHDIKILYGLEANLVDDGVPIAYNVTDFSLKKGTYVVFD